MSSRLLWRTALISFLGSNSLRPLRTAVLRLITAFGMASGLGLLIALSMWHANLPQDLPLLWLTSVVATIGYVLSGFLLFATNSSNSYCQRGQSLDRIVRLLPISKKTRWLVALAPSATILWLIATFGLLVVAAISHATQSPFWALASGWTLGLASGFGFTLLQKPHKTLAKVSLFILSAVVCLVVLEKTLTLESISQVWLVCWLLLGGLCLPLIGYVTSYAHAYDAPRTHGSNERRAWLPNPLPIACWFIVKLLHSRRNLGTLGVALLFSTSTAIMLALRHSSLQSTSWLILPAILSAAYACDVRGLMRRHHPPEAVLLGSNNQLVSRELASCFGIAIVIGLPVLVVLLASGGVSVLSVLATFVSLQFFAASIGLLASTVFVPGNGEAAAQFFSATLASVCLLTIPKLFGFGNISTASQNVRWLACALFCWVVIIIIEQARSKSYARSR